MTQARRRFGRYVHRLPVELTQVDGTCTQAETVDIGLGGMGVLTDLNLPFGTVLTFTVSVPKPAHQVKAQATVMWSKPGEGLGLAFESLRPLDVWALLRFFEQPLGADEERV